MAGVYSSLPWEIITDILTRFPVKSLCRFTSVSKSWLALILDPEFVKNHFNRALENEDVFYQRRRLLFTEDDGESLYTFHLDEFLNHYKHQDHPFLNGLGLGGNDSTSNDVIGEDYVGDLAVTRLKMPSPISMHFWMRSFCRGLVLYGSEDLYVANPATRKYKKLPGPSAPFKFNYGFGYDHTTDDYKVVIARPTKYGMRFIVYALKSKSASWRRIPGNFPYRANFDGGAYPYEFNGVLFNGRLHWLMERRGDESQVLVSLSLAGEEVREIPLPRLNLDEDVWSVIELGLLFKERLFISHTFHGEMRDRNEFWVMNEYGMSGSWTKTKVFPEFPSARFPFGYWRENHVIFSQWLNEGLTMYNVNDSSCKDLFIPGFALVTRPVFYVESLVPLDDHCNFNEYV